MTFCKKYCLQYNDLFYFNFVAKSSKFMKKCSVLRNFWQFLKKIHGYNYISTTNYKRQCKLYLKTVTVWLIIDTKLDFFQVWHSLNRQYYVFTMRHIYFLVIYYWINWKIERKKDILTNRVFILSKCEHITWKINIQQMKQCNIYKCFIFH